ncbi:MAG: hypothetical protein DMG13_03595 [Acidobacteria bacterium]|nr:MAG: hypothetical protein DMG13_03595 [Acidobacteriota bacterium]
MSSMANSTSLLAPAVTRSLDLNWAMPSWPSRSSRRAIRACPTTGVWHFLNVLLVASYPEVRMKVVLSVLMVLFLQDDLYKEGVAQLEAKHYDEAESAFRQMIEADASNSKAFEGLARVDIARKDYDKALEDATKSVELDGENGDAHYALGLAHAYRLDFENAAPSLEKALSLNPDNAYAHYQLGLVQYKLKRYDQTILHFEKFLELKPDAPEAPQVRSILKTVRS